MKKAVAILVLFLFSAGCIAKPKVEISNWPYGYRSAVCPTFEVETASIDDFRAVKRALGSRNATFFVVAGYFYNNPRGLYLLRNYEVANLDWNQTDWRKSFTSRNFQEAEIKKTHNWLGRIGYKPHGFRAPFLLSNEDIFRVLRELEYEYDSSQYFGLLPYKVGDIVEIPVSLNFDPFWSDTSMRYSTLPTYLMFQKTYEEGGLFTFLTHVSKASKHVENFTRFLKFLDSRNVWIASCSNVADWWLKKEKLDVERIGDTISVRNKGPEDVEGVTLKIKPSVRVIGASKLLESDDTVYAVLPPIPAGGEVSVKIVTSPSFFERLSS
jgi:peptidoglycan/xylan/chitin deacetylase (PgdA/CDA1 family)